MRTEELPLQEQGNEIRTDVRTFTEDEYNCLMPKKEWTLAGLSALSPASAAACGSSADADTAARAACQPKCWFVLRDLTRSNAKRPGYLLMEELGMRFFTPMRQKSVVRNGRKTWIEVPFMHDLLFVYASRAEMDPIVEKSSTLQYRFVRGGWQEAMTVPTEDMERFIHAVKCSTSPRYFRPDEITPEMYGKRVRIVGGVMDGYEGPLLSLRGSKVKRLLVELPNQLTAAVEVQPDLIEVLK